VRRSKPDADAPGASDKAACNRAALTLLAHREHGRQELARKLAARGFEASVVAVTLDELEASGSLAEARFTESFIRSRVGRGQGPARIRAELAQRGVADADVDDALRGAEVDWLEVVRAARRKRFGSEPPRDLADKARQARFLTYRGFDGALVRAALEFDPDSDPESMLNG
jgi:regulatory protein